jgi:hypothetical protein
LDIAHYLHQRPIQARRESVWSRTRKLVRRNRALVSAAAAAATLTGIAAGWVGHSAASGSPISLGFSWIQSMPVFGFKPPGMDGAARNLIAGGNIWIAEGSHSTVQKFSASGDYVGQIGGWGASNGRLNLPIGVAIDSSGNIWVADQFNYRAKKFSSSGVYLGQFGSYGSRNGQFDSPMFIAISERQSGVATRSPRP